MQDFINNLNNFTNGNENLSKFLLVLIAGAFLLLVPIFVTSIFPLFKNKLSPKGNAMLYAFVTGFFLILATFGFLREGMEISSVDHMDKAKIYTLFGKEFSIRKNVHYFKYIIYFWNITLIVGGLIVGLLFAFGLKSLIKAATNKKMKNDPQASIYIHSHELTHDPNEPSHNNNFVGPDHKLKIKEETTQSNPKLKIVALLLLLAHRIPSGILIGYNLNAIYEGSASSLNIAFIISFILHLIPEEVIYYYRQRDMGIPRWKAMLISLGIIFLFIPLMLIGIYLGRWINSVWQVKAFVYAFVGGIFIFTSVVEFLPEFFHSHHDKKLLGKVMIMFFVGVATCAFVLSFHQHGVSV